MKDKVRYVGMDVHKLTITMALADEGGGEPLYRQVKTAGIKCLMVAPSPVPQQKGTREDRSP